MTESFPTGMVKGLHRFTLEKYSLCKRTGRDRCIQSSCFTVGGHKWAILVYPDGTSHDQTHPEYEEGHIYLDLYVGLMSYSDGITLCITMTLLDQSGNGNHRNRVASPCVIDTDLFRGFTCFIDREELERSPYLKDDCLKIECTIGILLPSESKMLSPSSIIVPQRDDVGVDFLSMLKSGEGSDVVLNVNGEKFRAHKVILSARSSVFATLLVSYNEEIAITNMEPLVMEALLHFIYSDTLPQGLVLSGTFGAKLFAAADKFNVKRLKCICESHLWTSISLSRFAEILSLAAKHNSSDLKRLCFEYAAHNYHALSEVGSLSYLGKNFPWLLNELNDYISRDGSLLRPEEMKEKVHSTGMTIIYSK